MSLRLGFVALLAGVALPTSDAAAQRSPNVSRLMARMTVAQKAAQLIMPWVAGGYTAYDDSTFARIVRLVDSLGVGGVVISIGSPVDIAVRLNHLQRRARIPLLVASDFEGGTAFRFIPGGTAFPTNMGVGAGGLEQDAREMGRIIAQEGRAVGVHLTFSPVADVNNNPANPIINTRSFGGDPRRVADLVAAQVRGTQEHGMLATAKHFPGHGDTDTDSHLALPVVTADWARMDSLELVPFRAAIGAGVAAVMTAHIALPALDSGRTRPATMAPEILTGILRDSLGFTGLIITDALDMGGVVSAYGAGEAAVSALLAGSDILLMPTDPVEAVRAIVRAVDEGRVSRARLDASVRRVLELKRRLGLFGRRLVNVDSVGHVVARRAAQERAAAASARSVVLLRDSLGMLDSLTLRPRRVALVSYAEGVNSPLGTTLAGELRLRGHTVTVSRLWPPSGPAAYDSARAAMDTADAVIFAVAVRAREGAGSVSMPEPLGQLIATARRPALLASFGSPYLVMQVPEVPAYLLAWTTMGHAERAVAAALHGAPITGRLPVEIPPLYRIGDGITRAGRTGSPR